MRIDKTEITKNRPADIVLVETRTPWEGGGDVTEFLTIARHLAARNNRVYLYLIQNGAMMAADREDSAGLTRLAKSFHMPIWVDEFSFFTRNLKRENLLPCCVLTGMDRFISLLAAGNKKVIWH